MKLTKNNGIKLFNELKEEFYKNISIELKNEGIQDLESYCDRAGLSEYQVFVLWYNEYKGQVSKFCLKDASRSIYDENVLEAFLNKEIES